MKVTSLQVGTVWRSADDGPEDNGQPLIVCSFHLYFSPSHLPLHPTFDWHMTSILWENFLQNHSESARFISCRDPSEVLMAFPISNVRIWDLAESGNPSKMASKHFRLIGMTTPNACMGRPAVSFSHVYEFLFTCTQLRMYIQWNTCVCVLFWL